jgi:hypothetical protein
VIVSSLKRALNVNYCNVPSATKPGSTTRPHDRTRPRPGFTGDCFDCCFIHNHLLVVNCGNNSALCSTNVPVASSCKNHERVLVLKQAGIVSV